MVHHALFHDIQCDPDNSADRRRQRRFIHSLFCALFACLRFGEPVIWVHLHSEVRDDAETTQSSGMGSGKHSVLISCSDNNLTLTQQESKKSRAGAFWNVWVLLAMPAVYLAW